MSMMNLKDCEIQEYWDVLYYVIKESLDACKREGDCDYPDPKCLVLDIRLSVEGRQSIEMDLSS
jgi:hypothetical protein